MFAKYNSIGQMVDEKWQNSTGTDIAHYKYVYDGKGNIVRSIDFSGKKEYIATFKIAVTLDNCSKKWYNMSQGDEKNG